MNLLQLPSLHLRHTHLHRDDLLGTRRRGRDSRDCRADYARDQNCLRRRMYGGVINARRQCARALSEDRRLESLLAGDST
jgi:hypothetical protein